MLSSPHRASLAWATAGLLALLAIALPAARAEAKLPQPPAAESPFAGDGIWIWYLSKANRGDPARIAATARRRGVEVVYVKAGDGSSSWSQFRPALVRALQNRGLRVCAWQYVYGDRPRLEANVGATAVRRGADCLVIDAEAEYEGRYVQASIYIRRLRFLIGKSYPVGLAAFPYVDYHPSFPFSVFLGPNGAQFNVPQLYWHTIGDRVDWAFRHTFVWNRPYGRPVLPLGQSYSNPPPWQMRRFRRLAATHGMAGVSWWSWQHTVGRGWRAIGPARARRLPRYRPTARHPYLRWGSTGDIVVWAQQLLAGGGYTSAVTGYYGPTTRGAVRRFQRDHGLRRTGTVARGTWWAMLRRLTPLRIRWTWKGAVAAAGPSARAVPRSASLPARGYEIPRDSRRSAR